MNSWLKELVMGQVVYLREPEGNNKVRLSPVLITNLDSNGGIAYKHPPVGLMQFNNEGQIITWGSDTLSDQIIVPAPEGTEFNDPDQIVDASP